MVDCRPDAARVALEGATFARNWLRCHLVPANRSVLTSRKERDAPIRTLDPDPVSISPQKSPATVGGGVGVGGQLIARFGGRGHGHCEQRCRPSPG